MVTLVAILAVVTASAFGADSYLEVAHGRIGKVKWIAEAAPYGSRQGICTIVITYFSQDPSRKSEGERCSRPALNRGSVIGSVEPGYRSGRPSMTAIFGAFDPGVRRVVFHFADGHTSSPALIRHLHTGVGHVSRFRYFAFATKGPFCATALVTYDSEGKVLWHAGWRVLANGIVGSQYHNQKVCRP